MRNRKVVHGGWLTGLPIPVARQVQAIAPRSTGGGPQGLACWWMRTQTMYGEVREATLIQRIPPGVVTCEIPVIRHGRPVPPFTAGGEGDSDAR